MKKNNEEVLTDYDKNLHKKIDDTHRSSWHKYAGITSTISLLLPIMSEFEGVIADNFIMSIGGAGAVSVFAILMKVGRVASMMPIIEKEHHEHLKEEVENHKDRIGKERQRRIDSDYLHDF
jgi:hypothetical protein|tara:strand:- start:3 stop:365 length:363 start_codon:yes stop_codon:yes gene_type:complete